MTKKQEPIYTLDNKKQEPIYKLDSNKKIELAVDIIDESMEELAAIASAWQKNRDRNRPSPILRRALIGSAQELVDNVEIYHKKQCADNKRAN